MKSTTTLVWFRKCLRLHDNAALVEAVSSSYVVPLFVLDPTLYATPHRLRFLVESLEDLDRELVRRKSQLFVVRGNPPKVLEAIFAREGPLGDLRVDRCLWEADPADPTSIDSAAAAIASTHGVEARAVPGGHTIWDLEATLRVIGTGSVPTTMRAMERLADKLGPPPAPLEAPAEIPPVPPNTRIVREVPAAPPGEGIVSGGETRGLLRLADVLGRDGGKFAATFEKPKTRSTTVSTTLLSPYVSFGCVSARRLYADLVVALRPFGAETSKPPASLVGQLYFRELSYLHGLRVGSGFGTQRESPVCVDVPWDDNPALLDAWERGKTGYPYVDACMRMLASTGYLHHLARHSCACFLTRGDLWVSWEKGAAVFEKHLLDFDWAVNNFNWLWLAGTAPWSAPYFRVYSPTPDPRKSALNVDDENGDFVRRYVPELEHFPAKHIYAPWKCPIADQRKASCIIGKDYPKPVVDHAAVSKANIARFKQAVDLDKRRRSPASSSAKTATTTNLQANKKFKRA
ncbi:hypothetical protein CTAYLR_010695 [Chrysophaeum taylorii]|uniref:Photolyase/cryptochrome alpha/beta domain-containing protein n=1 Tax=Chrysophaeum taylorii TaxID=2483200 RepID=A0AAD7UB95_9STRA|nr:hypothetical protein CTAYLR_010695 [Chrysophaeum taylorii]